jgi:pantoate--beta-alanine ligase
MRTISSLSKIKKFRDFLSGTIGFVPTMGAIHAGHLSLIKKSKQMCKHTVVSIFINPTQFSPNEDLSSYPKSVENDLKLLNELHVDAVFLPNDDIIYPKQYSTFINENILSKVLEGKRRPQFFQGVVTIVAKLFNIINPTHSFFGEKDAQQLRIITKMVKDLNFHIKIIPCPIIREKNGLAMSSRNEYLSLQSKIAASIIYSGLKQGVALLKNGERNANTVRERISKTILTEPLAKIDYVSISDNESLQEIEETIQGKVLISAAVYINSIRLIDNISY